MTTPINRRDAKSAEAEEHHAKAAKGAKDSFIKHEAESDPQVSLSEGTPSTEVAGTPSIPVGGTSRRGEGKVVLTKSRSMGPSMAPAGKTPVTETGAPRKYFMPYQIDWINDNSMLRIMEKSRQIGISYASAYDCVIRRTIKGSRLDAWVSSRDDTQAKLFLEDCKNWAKVLNQAANYLGLVVYDRENDFSAYVLEFATGLRIYSLSSNPNAMAGKRGDVYLDEFALHKDQRLLYRIAKPVTTWGGQLSIISTHRGAQTVFNEIIRTIKEQGNTMGWSLHTVPLQKAVDQGLVERINEKTGRTETREDYVKRIHSECLDEEQWQQEYCCVPCDDSTAFISFEMITGCEEPGLRLKGFGELEQELAETEELGALEQRRRVFYLGVDVARKKDLCVLDLGEKIGDVVHDVMRVELQWKTFAEIKFELYRLLRLPQVKRCDIDATGMGMQLAEEAKSEFGWKVEPITFTGPVKEELAFGLRADFEDRRLRIVRDDKLRSDLRGIKKEVTLSGNIRFVGESEDSHCDRFWAKALRQAACRTKMIPGAMVG